jgi:AcrR family transcriptional regulator
MHDEKPLRADALRNRQRVLEVAQEVFATEGLAVPIDEIAQRAGVGVGTLYRHFPTKEALFAAVVLRRLEDAVADAQARLGSRDPGAAFFGFVERLVMQGSAKKDLAEALGAMDPDSDFKASLGEAKGALKVALGKLLARAQQAGAVRKDTTVADVFALVHGPFSSLGRDADPEARARLLSIVCDGLRAKR